MLCDIKFNILEHATIILFMYILNNIFRWSFPSLLQQWTMTIVDRSTEKSDHESVGCKQSPFSSGDVRMDSSCSSSWTVGPTKPSDSLRVKAPGCLGSASGAAVFNTTPSSVDRPKEQGGQITLSVIIHTWNLTHWPALHAGVDQQQKILVFLQHNLFFYWVVFFFIHSFYFKCPNYIM